MSSSNEASILIEIAELGLAKAKAEANEGFYRVAFEFLEEAANNIARAKSTLLRMQKDVLQQKDDEEEEIYD